jgi:hypothetical protein
MNQPATPKPLLQNRLLLVIIGIFALLVCVVLVIGAFSLARPQLAGLFPSGTATLPCGESRLVAGSATYRIQAAPSGTSDALSAIPSDPGLVYWIGGDSPNYVLIFNPDRQNQVILGTLKAGTPISVNWEDCSAGGYTVESVELRQTFDPAQVDPKLVGVTLYLPLDGTGRGLVVTASATRPY